MPNKCELPQPSDCRPALGNSVSPGRHGHAVISEGRGADHGDPVHWCLLLGAEKRSADQASRLPTTRVAASAPERGRRHEMDEQLVPQQQEWRFSPEGPVPFPIDGVVRTRCGGTRDGVRELLLAIPALTQTATCVVEAASRTTIGAHRGDETGPTSRRLDERHTLVENEWLTECQVDRRVFRRRRRASAPQAAVEPPGEEPKCLR